MRRSPDQLTQQEYDLVVIGGGIYGAFVAWDAALRGLSVALVDKADFGHATSSNNLRIIHGGLRYLQHGDFRRMRESIRERKAFMRIAPHLVHPLPFLMPTYGHSTRGKEIMSLALMMNDLVGFDRNHSLDPEKHLPAGRVISKRECLKLLPGVDAKGLTGGAIWYDCQMHNSERFIFSVLRASERAGAEMVNYAEVIGFLREGTRITGVKVKDVLANEIFEIRATIVVNASGPWVDQILGFMRSRQDRRLSLSKAMNIVVKRRLVPDYALGVTSRFEFKDKDAMVGRGSRLLFITPWQSFSLIGTTHASYSGTPDDFKVTEEDIQDFIHEVNEAYPAASLKREDVPFAYGGLLPMNGKEDDTGSVRLLKQYRISDHKKDDGVDGLISVVGVKYTTARDVAQRVIDLVFKKLGKIAPEPRTAETAVYGGEIEHFEEFLAQETNGRPYQISERVMENLVYTYGSAYPEVLQYLKEDPRWGETLTETSPVIKAEVLHGVRKEMALKLTDVILRRTTLSLAGHPGDECLRTCAAIMSSELGWSQERTNREVEEGRTVFSCTH